MPSTPTEFLVSEEKFFKCPNISTGAEIVGVWKTKSYLEDFTKIACFDIYVETNQPTNSDTDFKMIRIQTIKI